MRSLQPATLLADERGQSVQVGAAILLGFVVIAITMYQVQVVPDQNAEVEFNHNQELRQDMTELRNAIHNAGSTGTSTAVSVNLGTQYPPRTIFLNPPPPRGILETEPAGNISISNATVSNPSDYSTEGDTAQQILDGTHATSRISYSPRYTELDGAPTTTIEHSLGFNSFDDNASAPITPQGVVNGDAITLTVLRGNVSEQGSSATSIDPRTVTATEEIDIEPNSTDSRITLNLPTKTPGVWNETLGETFDEGESDARVASWDPAAGTIQVELDRQSYSFQIAMVGVGNGVPQSDRYDVDRTDGSGGGQGSYSLTWANPQDSDNGDPSLRDCGSERCTWDVGASDDDTLDLSASLDPAFDDTELNFTVNNTDVARVNPDALPTGSDGSAQTQLTANENGTVSVRATTDGAADVIEINVENVSSAPAGPNIETRLDDLTQQNANEPVFIASYDVSNTNSSFERVDVTFDSSDGEALSDSNKSERGGLRYEGSHGAGQSYTITYEVVYSDTNGNEYVAAQESVSDTADGVNPSSNADLSLASSAQLTSYAIDDRTITNENQVRYNYTYDVSGSGSFSEVRIHALNIPGNGSSHVHKFANRNEMDQDIQLQDGSGDEYRIGIVVRDANGVVVDVVSIDDTADGSGTYTGP